jgi:membrane-bound serine protease (ClpP class)
MGPGCKRVLMIPIFTASLWLAPLYGDAGGGDLPPRSGKNIGYVIHLVLPLDGNAKTRIIRFARQATERARAKQVQPLLIFEFDVPKGQEKFAEESDFGAAFEIANFLSGREINSVATAAYIPQSLPGHAVLAALACQQIIMGKDATLGPVTTDAKTVSPPIRSAYKEIAKGLHTLPEAVALGLLDPQLEVLSVKTELGTDYVTPDGLEELKKERTVQSTEVFKPAGETWQLAAGKLRLLGLVKYLADNRLALARALNLPPAAMVDDPSLTGEWKTVRIDLKGPIRNGEAAKIQKLIEDKIRQGVNFICLWIDSPGGKPVESSNLATFLAGLPSDKVRTVAYIPSQALAEAAVVAEACDQVVMRPDAMLGGPGADNMSPDEIAEFSQTIRQYIAPKKGRYWSLAAALIDPNLEVFQCSQPNGEEAFLSDHELQQPENAGKWTKGRLITNPNNPLQVKGNEAAAMGLAYRVVDDFRKFCNEYGLENEPELAEPGWANVLIDALGSTGMAVLLLLVGLTGLYLELHSPGMCVGAFVALVCFALFFWSRYLGGTAGWLEVILFLSGVTCLLLEIFVIPGFGIFGLGGGAMVIVSLILASQTFVLPRNSYQFEQLQRSLLTIAGAVGGLLVGMFFFRKWLPRTPILGRLVLEPPDEAERENIGRRELLVDLQGLVGRRGVTTTPLYPAGKARLGDSLVDVIADGEMIDRGKAIEVVEVRGNRVLVRECLGTKDEG